MNVRAALSLCVVALLPSPSPALAADIQGANGTFKTEVGRQDPMFPRSRDDIRITYTPDPKKVKCNKIVFAQTYRVKDQNGTDIPPQDLPGQEHHQPHATLNQTTIDQLSTAKDPYINGDDKEEDQPNKHGSSDGTTGKPGSMYDSPFDPDAGFPDGVTEMTTTFETCVICADDGKVLDCITWSYKRVKGAPNNGSITDATAAAPVTTEFKDAFKSYVATHKNGTLCPEAVAADNPGQKNAAPGVKKIVPEGPHPGQPSQVQWVIANASLATISTLAWDALLDDGVSVTTLATGTVGPLECFDVAHVSFGVPAVPPGQFHVVTLRVDPHDALAEYDETDNQESVAVSDQGLLAAPGVATGAREFLWVGPNPFTASSWVVFTLPRPGPVRVTVHDLHGRRVATLADRSLVAGRQAIRWDGRDATGRPVPSGVYLIRVQGPGIDRTARSIRLE